MFEIVLIFVLLVFNGLFAMAEIALVSARPARLKQLAEEGNKGAARALSLVANPERFLSTVQIGITLVGVFSGAFGGVALAARLEPVIASVAPIAPWAGQIAMFVVVSGITYFSLVVGELVPKGIALRHAEPIACSMSAPMAWLSRAAGPLVWLLELSTRMLLGLAGGAAAAQGGPTREEVQVLVREGIVTGMVDPHESTMLEGVFDLREVLAEEIMRPKPKVLFLQINESMEQIRVRVAASRQTVFPVHGGSRDEIIGMVSLRALFDNLASGRGSPLAELLAPPVFVAENQPALSLLQTLRASSQGAALVTDEFGTIRGLVSLEDLVEEIVGELRPELARQDGHAFRQLEEDSWIADGLMEIDSVLQHLPELEEIFESESEPFQTLAGYIVHRLDRLPVEGEKFRSGNFEFEILDMDRQRIDKVLLRRVPPEHPPAIEPDTPAG